MIKIWGTAFSLIGDLIMSLPQLNYFKSKYKDIYVNFVIHKKISYCAPLFFNHPLIDKIHISGEWSGFNENDYLIASECDVVTTKIDHSQKIIFDRIHPDREDWYNVRTCIEENALMSGITNLSTELNENEQKPYLSKWFDSGFEAEQKKAAYTYNKVEPANLNYTLSRSIAIWPFAGYGRSKNRNPNEEWWIKLIKKFTDNKINVYHFGYFKEPNLSENKNLYHKLTDLDFFTQIKISLGAKASLGTDSGSMWVLSAYAHPTITLLTNWSKNHNENFTAFLPINKSGDHIFKENGFKDLSIDEVYEKCLIKGISKVGPVDKFINKFW
jgi:ADP-heptose:LPS heptosyltransferase